VSTRRRPVATDPPRATGFFLFSRDVLTPVERTAATVAAGLVQRVFVASPRGYCAGVERAVETVERALCPLTEHPVYVRKQIVHNAHVVDDLERRGAVFVEDETDAPGRGDPRPPPHTAWRPRCVRPCGCQTPRRRSTPPCPLVTKVHVQARRYAAEGRRIVLIGHAGHEEVVGNDGRSAGGDPARRERRGRGSTRPSRRHTPLAYITQTTPVGRRDGGDHPGAEAPLPADPRSPSARTSATTHLEPSVGGQGDARPDRPVARDRLAELIQLESTRRGCTSGGCGRLPDRGRDPESTSAGSTTCRRWG